MLDGEDYLNCLLGLVKLFFIPEKCAFSYLVPKLPKLSSQFE